MEGQRQLGIFLEFLASATCRDLVVDMRLVSHATKIETLITIFRRPFTSVLPYRSMNGDLVPAYNEHYDQ